MAACRLALALGMDVSGSVDQVEYRLQMDGLAAALTNAEVQAQLLQMTDVPIWLSAYEWSGQFNHRLLVPWTALDSPQAIAEIAATLRGTDRVRGAHSTGIGGAMQFAEQLFRARPDCWRHTLDLSGDGTNNDGPAPQTIRDTLIGREINGLVIALDLTVGRDVRQMEVMRLSAYYRRNVIKGPNAFIEIAQGFDDFERAMTKKLLRETETLAVGRLGSR
ncbi:MAG: DUF1194 domain-containing protein [Pseudomonadota bacterium]